MRKIFFAIILLILTISMPVLALVPATAKTTTAILVDKKTNQLHLCEYTNGEYHIRKSYHATLGKVQGDKEDENDLKTPEGIYIFSSLMLPPALQPKFGAMGFTMDFPNAFDRLAGRRGNGIMLHATNEPERLKQNYDSQGCIVVRNDEIKEISPKIRLGLTPILVFHDLTPEFMQPGKDTELVSFFNNWIKSWEGKQIDKYINHYHSDFSASGKNRAGWKSYKANLNSRYSVIEIHPEDVHYYRHPKYSIVTFTQNYRSRLKSGGWGHRSRGTKILYIAEEERQPKIIAETFTNLLW